jgi:release factor glutamine methyltransferase
VLVPRPETEILVETALKLMSKTKERTRVLDLCTGSGAIAVTLKHGMPELEVYATDISGEALEIAKTNAHLLLPVKSSIHFFQGDLYEAISAASSLFSLIISNPPYIPTDEIQGLSTEVQNEPRLALDGGTCGLAIIKRIIEGAPKFLKKNGVLLMEADPHQMKKITYLLENKGFSDIKLYNDLSGKKRVITGLYE